MKEFIKSFFYFGLAISLENLLGLGLMPFYTRYFSESDYGTIDLIQSIINISIIFGALQLETALQRYYYDYSGIRKKLFISNVLGVVTGLSAIITFVLIVFSNQLSTIFFGDSTNSYILQISAFQILLSNFNMMGMVLLRFEKLNLKFLSIVILKTTTTLLFVLYFIFYLDMGIIGYFYAYVLSSFISTILVIWYIKDFLIFRKNKFFLKKSLIYSLPQFPARIGSVLMSQGNRFFMLHFLSLSAIGLFSVSLKLSSIMQMIYTAFMMAWGPFMFSQLKNKNHKQVFSLSLPVIASVIFFIVCIISLFSTEIFKLIVSEKFFEAHKYMGGLSLYFSLFIIKEIIDIGPKYKEKTKFLSYSFFISLIINFITLYFLTPLMELQGVTLSMIITNIALVAISWIISNNLYHIKFNVGLFAFLLVPVLTICIISMYINFTFITRIIIFTVLFLLYGVIFSLYKKRINNLKIKYI